MQVVSMFRVKNKMNVSSGFPGWWAGVTFCRLRVGGAGKEAAQTQEATGLKKVQRREKHNTITTRPFSTTPSLPSPTVACHAKQNIDPGAREESDSTHWFPIPVISSEQKKHTYTQTHIQTRQQLDMTRWHDDFRQVIPSVALWRRVLERFFTRRVCFWHIYDGSTQRNWRWWATTLKPLTDNENGCRTTSRDPWSTAEKCFRQTLLYLRSICFQGHRKGFFFVFSVSGRVGWHLRHLSPRPHLGS